MRLPILCNPGWLASFSKYFVPLSFVTLSILALFAWSDHHYQIELLMSHERAKIVLLQQRMRHELEQAKADLQTLAQLPSLLNWIEKPSLRAEEQMVVAFSAFSRWHRAYDHVRFMNTKGMERIRVNLMGDKTVALPKEKLKYRGDRDFFLDAMRLTSGEVFISPMTLNLNRDPGEALKPTVRLSTPIFDSHVNRIGVLVINLIADEVLSWLDQDRPQEGNSFLELLNTEGYWLHARDPKNEWAFMYGKDQSFALTYPQDWRRIQPQESGQFQGSEGLVTFSTIRMPVTESPSSPHLWKLVSRVTNRDLRQFSWNQRPGFWLIAASLLILMFLVSAGMATAIYRRRQAEEVQRESAEKYRSIFENSIEGICQVTPEGQFISVNPAMACIYGYESPEEMIASITDIARQLYSDPEDRRRYKAILEAQGIMRGFETPSPRKDGSIIWVSLSSKINKDANGKIRYYDTMVEDITERKRIEERLFYISKAVESSSNAIGISDPQGHHFYQNKALSDLFGYATAEELEAAGGGPALVKDPEIAKEMYDNIMSGNSWVGELKMVTKSGHVFPAFERADAIKDDAGKIIGLIGIITDISERMQAEEVLREKERLLSETQQIAHIGSWTVTIDSMQSHWSEESYHIFGVAPESFALTPASFLGLIHIDDRPAMEEWLHNCITGKHPSELEFRIIRPDGTIGFLCGRGGLQTASDGSPLRLIGSVQDITDRKRADEEKKKLQNQLNQTQKIEAIGQLAGGVAHDFNNMLGVILGHTELALDSVNQSDPLNTHLTEIQKAARRSSELTSQLLAFARKQTMMPKVLDLNDTIVGMLKMLRRLIGEDIDLNWIPDSTLWPVKTDPSQIDQILANLCVNARDAIDGVGKITIETRNISFDEAYCTDHAGFVPGDYVQLCVSDNGCGMGKEILDRLFEPFFTTKEAGKGTGLGLATVYGIVKQNSGYINVYSEPDQGTTFRIYLPRYAGQTEPASTEKVREDEMRGQETILMVEDEPSLLELNTLILESQGYRVLAAGAPGEAIRLADEHAGKIHLLLTDVVMPEMNGRDLAKNLVALNPQMKCLFTSGYTANVIAHHGVLDEGVSFIQKPFSRKDLAAKVREVLNQS